MSTPISAMIARAATRYAGDLIKLGRSRGERGDVDLDLRVNVIDVGLNRIDTAEHLGQERVMLTVVAGQRLLQVCELAAQVGLGQLRQGATTRSTRYRVTSRNRRISTGGTKLGRSICRSVSLHNQTAVYFRSDRPRLRLKKRKLLARDREFAHKDQVSSVQRPPVRNGNVRYSKSRNAWRNASRGLPWSWSGAACDLDFCDPVG